MTRADGTRPVAFVDENGIAAQIIGYGVERKIRNRTYQAVEALRTGFTYPAVDIEQEVQTILNEKAAKKAAFESKKS